MLVTIEHIELQGKGENKEMSNRGPILSLWNLYRIEDIVGQAEGTPRDQEIVSQGQYCPCENSKGSGNCQSVLVLLLRKLKMYP